MSLRSPNAVRHHDKDYFILDAKFTTVASGNPTVFEPNYGTDMVLARSAVGVYTYTFSQIKKPRSIRCAVAQAQGNKPNTFATCEYNATTGVLTVRVFVNAAGAIALADDAGAVVQVIATCTNNV